MHHRAAHLALFPLLLLFGLAGAHAAPRVKRVDLFVVSEKTFVPGSSAGVRVLARAVRSLTDSQPLAGAQVTISLSGKGKHQQLFSGRSDGKGAVEAAFRLPQWPLGAYQMAVQVQSESGQGKVEQGVELRRRGRILLVTDKPIYQPRQIINMRALALSVQDLRPLQGEAVRFEVQDPKGNKVFRKDLRTSSFGVAATTFQLADEINLGNYQVEVSALAKDLAEPAAKTVVVKKYVLPKFKVAVETDRSYYLPRQTLKGTLRSDYFFGKPVSGGKVLVEASTFDGTSFQKFSTVKGQTGKDGSWSFEVKLPDYFVGQPLMKGDALVKLEVKVTDTANHSETGIRSVPVAAAPIRLTAIPESGRLIPDLENQLFVVATYPDGSPAQARVTARAAGKQVGSVQTDSSGVGVISFTPREKEMRPGRYQQRTAPGRSGWVQTRMLDLSFSVRDGRGNTASVDKSFSTDPDQDQLLLRTDKAIYRTGEVLEATVLATGGGPDTLYLDVVKNRQTLLTRAVYLKQGKGTLRLPLGGDLFGSLELHAYRIEPDGEISRDARVLYVQPPSELNIEVSPDQKVYRPGGKAAITFRVTDGQGRPQAAALGVVIVDEAVYALQEIQPGLEKVYFTLERELSNPKYQIEFAPADNLADMIKAQQVQEGEPGAGVAKGGGAIRGGLDAQRQRVAKVLLAGARPAAAPTLWENPVADRLQKAQQSYYYIRSAIYQGVYRPEDRLFVRTASGGWAYAPDLLRKLRERGRLSEEQLKDPLGEPYTLRSLEKLWPDLAAQSLIGREELNRLWSLRYQVQVELSRRTGNLARLGALGLAGHLKAAFNTVVGRGGHKDPAGKTYTWARVASLPGFRPEDFAAEVNQNRAQQIYYALSALAQRSTQAGGDRRVTYDVKRNAWVLPTGAIREANRRGLLHRQYLRDAWGRPFVLRGRTAERPGPYYYDQRLRFYDVVSAGADGQLATADDLVYPRTAEQQDLYRRLTAALGVVEPAAAFGFWGGGRGGGGMGFGGLRARRAAMDALEAGGGARDEVATGALVRPTAAAPAPRAEAAAGQAKAAAAREDQAGTPVKREVRVREYFPETLLFAPALITDGQGQARLELSMADSITTWRMTASANSAGGSLGSTSHALKVFQDFFVDLDLPVSLTQNDEVSVPVVVYNYLKQRQRVRLELKADHWFELRGNRVMEMQLAPSEVAASYYRIKVKELGRRTLEVRADGSQMSDAIRREIEVLPDGQEQNLVSNGRLDGTVKKTISIPRDSVPGASKVLVRLYPGVFSQVIEGMQSMLRLPGG